VIPEDRQVQNEANMGAQPDHGGGKAPADRRNRVDSLRDSYRSAVRQSLANDPRGGETLPQVLAYACVASLPIAGAGLSLTGDLRIPLSASSLMVAEAERLQTSLGEGPCLTATAMSGPLLANADDLTRLWPVFGSELRRRTPFRSVASLPLRPAEGDWRGAMDLYSTDPSAPFGPLDEIHAAVSESMVSLLMGQSDWSADLLDMQPTRSAAQRRMTVWTAVGLLMASADVDHNDALALLRAFTFRHELDLDLAAELIVSRTVPPEAVLDAD
jgi:hypothetical protein